MTMECKKEVQFDELKKFIDEVSDKKGTLIGVLHKAQHLYGYLSDELIFFISKELNVPTSKIFGVISFYSFFTTKPRGENVVSICLGTACFVRGAEVILKEFERELKISVGETTQDNKFTLSALRCIGACGLAPVVMINDRVYGRVTPDQVVKILSDYMEEGKNE